jgi:hypothetical protein
MPAYTPEMLFLALVTLPILLFLFWPIVPDRKERPPWRPQVNGHRPPPDAAARQQRETRRPRNRGEA